MASTFFSDTEPHYTPEEDDRPGGRSVKHQNSSLPGFIIQHPDPHQRASSFIKQRSEEGKEEENGINNKEGFFLETTRFADCFDVVAIVVSFLPLDAAHALRGVSKVWHSAAFEHVKGMRGQVKRFVIAYNEQIEHEMNSKVLKIDQKTKLAWVTWNTGTILIGIMPWMYMDGPWQLPWNIPHLAAAILWFFFMLLSFLCYGHFVIFQMVKKATYPVFFSSLIIVLNVLGAIAYTCIAIFPEAWVEKKADGGTEFRIGFAFYYLFVGFLCFMYTNLPLFSLLQFIIPLWYSADGLRIHSKQIRNPISANIHENEDTGMVVVASSSSLGGFQLSESGGGGDPSSPHGSNTHRNLQSTAEEEGTTYDEVAEKAEIEGNNKLPVLLACFFNVSEKFLKARRKVTVKEVIAMMEDRRELWEQEVVQRDIHTTTFHKTQHEEGEQAEEERGGEDTTRGSKTARKDLLGRNGNPIPPKAIPQTSKQGARTT